MEIRFKCIEMDFGLIRIIFGGYFLRDFFGFLYDMFLELCHFFTELRGKGIVVFWEEIIQENIGFIDQLGIVSLEKGGDFFIRIGGNDLFHIFQIFFLDFEHLDKKSICHFTVEFMYILLKRLYLSSIFL